MMVRVAWGGGSEKSGKARSPSAAGPSPNPGPGDRGRRTGLDVAGGRPVADPPRSPRAYDGVDIVVTAPADAKLIVQLAAAGDSQRGPQIEVPLADISSEFRNLPLDDRENRLLVRRAPGDSLLVRMSRPSMVFSPGETMRFEVIPHLLPVAADTRVQIQAQLLDAQQRQLWSSEQDMRGAAGEAVPLESDSPGRGRRLRHSDHGPTERRLAAGLRQSLRWKRAIAERRVQLVVISPAAAGSQAAATN